MGRVGIIGGGVVGMCAAWYLRHTGHEVVILDKGDMRGGCSWGNAGMIVPSHFVPLAAPGMISKGIRWMFNPASPFYVRPRIDRGLLRWGWEFYRNSTHKRVEQAAPVLRDLSLYSLGCYQQLSQDLPFELHTRGLLMLFRKQETGEEEIETVEMAHRLGLNAKVLSLAEVRALEPRITIKALGGIFFPGDHDLSPASFMSALRKRVVDVGVRLLPNTAVTGFRVSNGRITGLETNDGDVVFDQVVLAAGVWSHGLGHSLGLTIPVEAGKGYSFLVRQSTERISIPTLLLDDRVAVTPLGEDVRFGGTMEIGGINHSINMQRVQGIVDAIPKYYPHLNVDMPPATDVWHGLRPCSPDGLPIIGRVRSFSNLLVATGHGMMGVSLAPGTGRLIADMINERPSEMNTSAFSPARFE
jgi:D-amino-acid dehydrogenase